MSVIQKKKYLGGNDPPLGEGPGRKFLGQSSPPLGSGPGKKRLGG